jgi:hypothetical protein
LIPKGSAGPIPKGSAGLIPKGSAGLIPRLFRGQFPVHEVLNGLTVDQIKILQTSIASTNIAARYKFVAKCLMGNIFDAVEQATAQLKDCEKVIMDGTVLLLNSHYGVAGTMSWETFSADMTEAIATKAAQAGAIAGAAAAAAHHAGAGAGDIQFG